MDEVLLKLLEPEVTALGLELVDLEYHPQGGGGLLRIYIDRPGTDAEALGVTVEDCAAVSRRVSDVLDLADPIPGEYTLEVSSPGSDRPLRTQAHFVRFVGSRIKVESLVAREGRRRWTGQLVAVEGSRITLEVDYRSVEFELKEIKLARLVP
jgi:ribosome maturation factor RimP